MQVYFDDKFGTNKLMANILAHPKSGYILGARYTEAQIEHTIDASYSSN